MLFCKYFLPRLMNEICLFIIFANYLYTWTNHCHQFKNKLVNHYIYCVTISFCCWSFFKSFYSPMGFTVSIMHYAVMLSSVLHCKTLCFLIGHTSCTPLWCFKIFANFSSFGWASVDQNILFSLQISNHNVPKYCRFYLLWI